MGRKCFVMPLLLLLSCGLSSCNLFGVFKPDDTPSTPEKKDSNNTDNKEDDNINIDININTPEENQPVEEPEKEILSDEEKKQRLINDNRILNSKGIGFTYLDYDLNEQFKSWDKLVEDENIVLENNEISSSDTDKLGKGVLELPSDVSSVSLSAKIENDLVNSVVLGGTTWSEQYKSLSLIGKNAKKITLREGTTTVWGTFFSSCKNVEEIVLPSTITDIKIAAFMGCSSLKKVNLEDTNLTTVGGQLFKDCTSIEEIILPSTIDGNIGLEAFYNCKSLKNIVIPNGINSVGKYAFYDCTELKSNLILNSGATIISEAAFYNCSNCEITFNSKITKVEEKAFYNCSKLTNIDFSKLGTIGNFAFYNTKINNAVLSSLTENRVNISTFANSKNLTTVVLSDSVSTIGDSAFEGSSNLINVISSGNINNVGRRAFKDCTSLSNANFVNHNSSLSISEYAFANCGTITNDGVIDLRARVINNYAFAGSKIKEVNFVGDDSFKGFFCIGLFKDCTSLEKFTYKSFSAYGFPIFHESFSGCTNLKEISIISTDTEEINSDRAWPGWRSNAINIFEGCTSLKKITFYGTVDTWIKSFYDDIDLGGEEAKAITNLGTDLLDLRKSNVEVICLNGCKKSNEVGSITLSKTNIVSYIDKVK